MKAALLDEIGKPLRVADVPCPEIGPDEVLIATRTCGICRTDLHIQDGLAYVPNLPHVPGHEPAGVVAEVGHDVDEIAVGQRVVPHLFVRSGECRYSLAGQDAQATHLEGIIGVTLPGGFAEYFKAPARNLLVLPDEVPFDAGGLTSCAVITAVHAYRKAGLERGDTAVVLGAGGIGLILVQLLASAGVRTVAVSRSPASLALANGAGAALAIRADADDTIIQIREFAGPGSDGADVVFEMVGRADTMKAAASYVRRGGRIVVIGEEAEYPAIDTIAIAQRELEIVGARNGGRKDAVDALEMMATGAIR
ncbi:MAG: alcohol dehydrogenase catalytic domain-containing protein, partial [Planctomycetales bacterium]|nr:alcohol dehydrogenase catalytic domain-containing protein [Planctomycetales bacterium]